MCIRDRLEIPAILEFATFDRKYEGIAKFPAVSRDISMVVPKHVLAGEIEHVLVPVSYTHLDSVSLSGRRM